MTFEEALKELRDGCEIRRAEWDTKLIKVYENILYCIPSRESYRVSLCHSLNTEDILAEDWEVVDE